MGAPGLGLGLLLLLGLTLLTTLGLNILVVNGNGLIDLGLQSALVVNPVP